MFSEFLVLQGSATELITDIDEYQRVIAVIKFINRENTLKTQQEWVDLYGC